MRSNHTILSRAIRTALTGSLLLAGVSSTAFAVDTSVLPSDLINSGPITFNTGDLVVTSSIYEGTNTAITPGTTLLSGTNATTTSTATADSSYLNVWNNTKPDGSFGVTSPLLISDVSTNGTTVNTYNLTAIAAAQGVNLVTSFSSKSELAVNLSTNGSSITLNGYTTTSGNLDVSNSNTPGVIDSTNPTAGIGVSPTYRSIAQINLDGSLQVTNTNAYSGNNGRATVLDNNTNTYFEVGNAGNSGKPAPAASVLATLSSNTGVQAITPGSSNPNTTVIGALTSDGQHGFSITQTNPLTGQPYSTTSDKVGKDDNFRGETVFDNTLYVTKGSGGNGIDTVYQVGATGSLDSLVTNATTTTITPLPGFPTGLASGTPTNYPFGIWFANATTLYVADEGAGGTITANGGATGVAASDNQAGLEKWVLGANGVWTEAYVLQAGLNLGVSYSVSGVSIGSNDLNGAAGTYTAATDGLRQLAGQVNADGTVTLYATTSTISNSGDQGADPNKLVAITDNLSATTAAAVSGESFGTLQTAAYGEVLRGVSFAPTTASAAAVPVPSSILMMLSGLGFTALFGRRNKRA